MANNDIPEGFELVEDDIPEGFELVEDDIPEGFIAAKQFEEEDVEEVSMTDILKGIPEATAITASGMAEWGLTQAYKWTSISSAKLADKLYGGNADHNEIIEHAEQIASAFSMTPEAETITGRKITGVIGNAMDKFLAIFKETGKKLKEGELEMTSQFFSGQPKETFETLKTLPPMPITGEFLSLTGELAAFKSVHSLGSAAVKARKGKRVKIEEEVRAAKKAERIEEIAKSDEFVQELQDAKLYQDSKIAEQMKKSDMEAGIEGFEIVEDFVPKAIADAPLNAHIPKPASPTKRVLRDAKTVADNMLGSISTRLKNINPIIKYRLRKMEYDLFKNTGEDLIVADTFLKEAKKKLPKKVLKEYDIHLKNRDRAASSLVEKEYGITGRGSVDKILDGIWERAESVGLKINKLKDYFPREVKDYHGLMEYFKKIGEIGEITRAIKEKEMQSGKILTIGEKTEFVGSLIQGRGNSMYLVTPHAKHRRVPIISEEIAPYYRDMGASLTSYIYAMNKKIEARRFFGEIPKEVKKLKARKRSLENKDSFLAKEELEGINRKLDRLQEYDIDASINSYIMDLLSEGKIDPLKEGELVNILRGRFREKGVSGAVATAKNIAYIDVMGDITSAATQLGDIALSLAKNGFYRTGKAIVDISAKKKGVVKKEDLWIKRIGEEFADTSRTAKTLNGVFKASGLNKIDAIGKEVRINSSLKHFRDKAHRDPKKLSSEIEPIFEKNTQDVIKDLKNGVVSENVKLLLFNDLLDAQPLALSEMPLSYLTSGNGRVFYMLKTYTLKLLDVYRNEVIHKMSKPGTRAEGVKNMVKLTTALSLCNAGVDEIKDFVLGREVKFSDKVIDNLVRTVGLTRYTIAQGKKEGIGKAMAKLILPPTQIIDSVGKDIYNMVNRPEEIKEGLHLTKSIPLIGKTYYWRFGRGSNKKKRSK